ncbi:uncharacterized protein K444DRAFT_694674 [Hyaloscypha bicolor E]|uniref:Uncharacterized protein n=1 Tax=Hyaloscypha bicolor E TaxID=1095630 RepID=A0A2J6SXY8_9HELO|nr:uncharacterized protein K444DRAFT_694674 [Hyaloscypha bicolor E]PMD55621.1 hypothetical protein K444DRAFT_694674 [Hyaloscypha bicolor E]
MQEKVESGSPRNALRLARSRYRLNGDRLLRSFGLNWLMGKHAESTANEMMIQDLQKRETKNGTRFRGEVARIFPPTLSSTWCGPTETVHRTGGLGMRGDHYHLSPIASNLFRFRNFAFRAGYIGMTKKSPPAVKSFLAYPALPFSNRSRANSTHFTHLKSASCGYC